MNIKKRWIFVILILLVISTTVSAKEFTTSDRRPMVSLTFKESSIIHSAVLKKGTQDFELIILNDLRNLTYRFQPSSVLPLGEYKLTIQATDVLGNPSPPAVFNYDINVTTLIVDMNNPRFGYAITNPFDIEVESEVQANCSYSTIPIPFDSQDVSQFDSTDSELHLKSQFNRVGKLDFSFYVHCLDIYDEITTTKFQMYVDTTPIIITRAQANPTTVVGEPVQTIISVDTDKSSLCKYSLTTRDYKDMEFKFDSWDDENPSSFSKSHSQTITDIEDKKTYRYYVACENYGGALSETKDITFNVDFEAPLEIDVHTPRYVSKTPVYLNLTTNRIAEICTYGKDAPTSSMGESGKEHLVMLNDVLDGDYIYKVKCASLVRDKALEANVDVTFSIDTTPPVMKSINDGNISCQLGSGDYNIRAELVAEDEIPIDYYIYNLKESNGAIVVNDTISTDGKIEILKDHKGNSLNLSNGKIYYLQAKAVNKAGLVTKKFMVSDGVMAKAADDDVCLEKNPPIIKILTKPVFGGINLTLACSDIKGTDGKDPSGCDNNKTRYDYALAKADCYPFSQDYKGTFFINKDYWVCYNAYDYAGNKVEGTEFINLSALAEDTDKDNVSDHLDNCPYTPNPLQEPSDIEGVGAACAPTTPEGCIVDVDGDGYGLGCFAGQDCDDTNKFVNRDCLNGCVQDSDGDGYGMGCSKGSDCDDTKIELNTVCVSGCILDNDGDGFGLGCLKGLDCNDADTSKSTDCESGCKHDSDGDGFGIGCFNGADCNDNNYVFNGLCPNKCKIDTDGDNYGMGCEMGPDCDDTNPKLHVNCRSGCIQDSDGDKFGLGCKFDCNDMDPSIFKDCPNKCVHDGDGDGYGYGCVSGDDCDDGDYLMYQDCTSGCKVDIDSDSFGLCCDSGVDCNDFNPLTTIGCTSGCTYDGDCDSMDDDWEAIFGLDISSNDASNDPDDDGKTNKEEFCSGREPNFNEEENDRDGDGINDDWEDKMGLDKTNKADGALDQDSDGLTSYEEYLQSDSGKWDSDLNPFEKDTDGDGYGDGKEVDKGYDATNDKSHPQPVIAIILVILGLLCIASGGSYLGYKRYQEYRKAHPYVSKPKPRAVARGKGVAPKPAEKPLFKRRASTLSTFEERMLARQNELRKVFRKFKPGQKQSIKPTLKERPTFPRHEEKAEDVFRKVVQEPKKTEPIKQPNIFGKLSSIIKKKSDFDRLHALTQDGRHDDVFAELGKLKPSEFDKLHKISKNKEGKDFDELKKIISNHKKTREKGISDFRKSVKKKQKDRSIEILRKIAKR